MRRYLPILLLLLAIPLMGVSSKEALGCSCGGSGDDKSGTDGTGPTEGELPGGGGVAASTSYSVDRSQVGMSWNAMDSSDSGYHLSATIGNWLSQGRTLSDKYLVHHPLTREVITDSSGLTLKEEPAK